MKNFIKKHFNVIFTVISVLILSFSITFVAISTGRLGGIKKDPLPDWETLFNEQNYGEVVDLKRSFSEDEIFDKTQEDKYYVYFYSPTCSHCSEIRETMTKYAVSENCKTMYFVDTSKNSVPGPSTPDSSLIKKITDSGEDRFLVDLNEDGIYSKKYDNFYYIFDTETEQDVQVDEKRVIFATETEAQNYITANLEGLPKYAVKTSPFEKESYYGYSTEWFSSLENAENALRFKEVRSMVGKGKFEDIKVYGTPSLLEITPSFDETIVEEGEETETNVSNTFEISNILIGETEIKNQMTTLNERLKYYKISYNLDGGHFLEGEEIPYEFDSETGLANLPVVYKDGVRFDYWEYLSSEEDTKMTQITSIPGNSKRNYVLYVSWTGTSKITFLLNGGHRTGAEETETEFYDTSKTIGSTYSYVSLPTNVSREEYDFKGWSLEPTGEVITNDFVLSEYVILYAQWTPKQA